MKADLSEEGPIVCSWLDLAYSTINDRMRLHNKHQLKEATLRTLSLTLCCLFLVSSLLGCKSTDSNSQLRHKEGDFAPIDSGSPAGTPRPWLWADVSREYVEAYPTSRVGLIPEGTELGNRLQNWVDAMYQYVVSVNPEMAAAPIPRLYIFRNNPEGSEIGLALPARVYYRVPVEISSEEGESEFVGGSNTIDLSRYDTSNTAHAYEFSARSFQGRVSFRLSSVNDRRFCEAEQHSSQMGCVVRDLPEEWLQGFAEYLNTSDASNFRATEDGKLILNGYIRENAVTGDGPSRSTADGIIVYVTANAVFIGYEMIEVNQDEEAVVGVIAHELGHYFKAHSSTFHRTTAYQYYYEQTEDNLLKKPERKVGLPDRTNDGYYTYEQEADEIAMELLHAVGAGYEALVDYSLQALRTRGEQNQGSNRNDQWLYDRCVEARENNWQERPPVALASNGVHASFCYRVFNYDREFQAHGYTKGIKPAELDGSWDSMRTEFLENFR